MTAPIVIVGSGTAAYTLATELRRLCKDQPITMVTKNRGDYYSKPILSNAFLKNKFHLSDHVIATAKQMSDKLKIGIYTETHVNSIDVKGKKIVTDGKNISYDKLVLAIGATPRQINIINGLDDCIFSVNDLESHLQFQQAIKDNKRIAILGSGLIACEFANDLALAGYSVDIISPAETPLDTLLPKPVGQVLQKALADEGVRWHFRTTLKSAKKYGRLLELILSNRVKIEVDVILSAIGLIVKADWLNASGIRLSKGIEVNEYFETNKKDIYALGDCIEMGGESFRHIAPILHGARSLAKTLTGDKTPVKYPVMPVIVKTPSFPITCHRPSTVPLSHWLGDGDKKHASWYWKDASQQLKAFVLTGNCIQHRQRFIQEIGLE